MSEATTAPAGGEQTAAATGGTVLGGGTTAAPDARAWLPEEYRTDPTFKDLADVAALAKGYKHAASLVGVDKAEIVRIPREGELPADQRAALLGRLGMAAPEAPDGYELKAPETIRPEHVGAFAEAAHKLGLSKSQAAGMMEFVSGLEAPHREALQAAAQQRLHEGLAAVKTEWGAAYPENAEKVVKLVTQQAGEESLPVLDMLIAEGGQPILNILARAAGLMLERTDLPGGGANSGTMTPADAKDAYNALMANPEMSRAITDANHPKHAEAVAERNRLIDLFSSHEPRNRQRPAA